MSYAAHVLDDQVPGAVLENLSQTPCSDGRENTRLRLRNNFFPSDPLSTSNKLKTARETLAAQQVGRWPLQMRGLMFPA